jgi:SAM-dependent methyltransferase
VNLKGGKEERFGPIKSFFYRLWAEPALSPMHARIAAEIPLESGRLLDVGCGPGRLTRRIADRHPGVRVTGVDLSEDMIREARKGPPRPNLEYRAGRVAALGTVEPFDFAVSVLSFHHWEEPAEDLAAIHRVLAPGGRLWIYEQDPEAAADAIHADRARLWLGLRVPIAWQRRLARGHGFTRGEVEREVRPLAARTPFGGVEVGRSGSCLRLELRK